MPTISPSPVVSEALARLEPSLDYEDFLAKLGAKDRLNAERHVTASETEVSPRHAKLWRRVACALMKLADHSAKLNGQRSVQFYVADGKYRMQAFALEDLRDGRLTIYCTDVLTEATKEGLITREGAAGQYRVAGGDDPVLVERVDGSAVNLPPFYKDMLGWNRKAMRIVVPSAATDAQLRVVETLCALARQKLTAAK